MVCGGNDGNGEVGDKVNEGVTDQFCTPWSNMFYGFVEVGGSIP